MQCERCSESAVTRRDNIYLCGRCALRIDWEGVVRTAQGVSVRQAVSAASHPTGRPSGPGVLPPIRNLLTPSQPDPPR